MTGNDVYGSQVLRKERIRKIMIEQFAAIQMGWEIPGPKDTSVEFLQLWSVPYGETAGIRLVIVEIYNDGGFEVFPQVCLQGVAETARVVSHMSEFETTMRD